MEKQVEGLERTLGSLKTVAWLPGRAPARGAKLPADAFCTCNPTRGGRSSGLDKGRFQTSGG